MTIRIPLATVVVCALFASQATAQAIKACDEDTLKMVSDQVAAASEAVQEAALSEMSLAQLRLSEGDLDACSMHLTNASNLVTGE